MNRIRERYLIHVMSFLRIPYIWGGENPKIGLDCSGLAQKALAFLQLDPPGDQTADMLMKTFLAAGWKKVSIEEADLGDVAFYGREKATHVTLPIGDGQAVGANDGGSRTTTVAIAKQMNAYVKLHYINYRSDLKCILRPPNLPWRAA